MYNRQAFGLVVKTPTFHMKVPRFNPTSSSWFQLPMWVRWIEFLTVPNSDPHHQSLQTLGNEWADGSSICLHLLAVSLPLKFKTSLKNKYITSRYLKHVTTYLTRTYNYTCAQSYAQVKKNTNRKYDKIPLLQELREQLGRSDTTEDWMEGQT